MCILNSVICKKALESQIRIHKVFFFFSPLFVIAETGREVPAEQARADRLWVPSAGGLGVCSSPSWARSDAALQTLGAELLALAALRERGSSLFPLGSPKLQYYWKCKIRLLTLHFLSPKQFFQQHIGNIASTWNSKLWQIYVSLLSQSRLRLNSWEMVNMLKLGGDWPYLWELQI